MAADTSRRFEVAPPGKAAWAFVLVLGFVFPLLLIAGIWLVEGDRLPPGIWITLPVSSSIAALLALAMFRRSVELVPGQLVVRATLYTLRLPVADIDLADARVVSLDEHREFKPLLKTNGFALPGFYAGHFRSGQKRRLFCLVTARQRVLALAESSGRAVLLSLLRPQMLLDALTAEQTARRRQHDSAARHGAR